jgi:hypothetical protein
VSGFEFVGDGVTSVGEGMAGGADAAVVMCGDCGEKMGDCCGGVGDCLGKAVGECCVVV